METKAAEFRVLAQYNELVVVEKPHDVPMDGDTQDGARCTVESWVGSGLADYIAEPLPLHISPQPGGGKPPNQSKSLRFVHQLDSATSGVLCLAFSKDMAARMAHCFEMRQTRKEYSALLHGRVDQSLLTLGETLTETVECGTRRVERDVDLVPAEGSFGAAVLSWPVGPDARDPTGFRMCVDTQSSAARPSLTVLSVMGYGTVRQEDGTVSPATKVHVRIVTGRRHQIRVHCAALGYPIVGDVTYTDPTRSVFQEGATVPAPPPGAVAPAAMAGRYSRMMLHAWRLTIGMDVAAVSELSIRDRTAEKRKRRRVVHGTADAEDSSTTTFEASDALAAAFTPTVN